MIADLRMSWLSTRLKSATVDRKTSWDAAAVLLLFLAAIALYARTVAPGVLDGDGGEFQTNIYRLGVSHTGYPLYFLLAKLWTLVLPVGSIAYRANLFSSFFGALTVVLIYVTMRVLADSRVAAFFTAALFAVSRVEWSQSVIPRVYTLNSFLIVLVILLALLWRSGRVSLLWLVFAFGLSLTHHRTMIFLAPALTLLILVGEGRALFRPKRLFSLLVAFVLPLLLYIYVPLRGDSDVGVEYHATNFADMILAGNASVWLHFGPPGFLWWRVTTAYLPLMVEQFTAIAIPFGLLGVVAVALKRAPRGFPTTLPPRQLLLLLGVTHLFESAFGIVFWTIDSEKYFIPSYLTFLFFVGIGLALIFDRLAQLRGPVQRAAHLAPIFFGALMVAVCLFLVVSNFPAQDLSTNDLVEARWQEIFSQPLEPHALLVGNWESLTPLEYYQYVDGMRRDIQRDKVVISSDQLKLAPQGDVAKFIASKLTGGQAVYLTLHPSQTDTLGALSQRFNLVPIASLWRVEKRQPPEPSRTLGARFGNALLLKSVALSPSWHAGDFAEMSLVWHSDEPLDARYKFSFRLRDTAGKVWMQREVDPFGGLKPTTEWATGNDTTDVEGFFVPPDAPPGNYNLGLALYNADSHETITADGNAESTLATIHVSSSERILPLEAYQIPHPLDVAAAGGKLVGYGLSNEAPQAGTGLDLSTWWSGLVSSNPNIHIELEDGHGARSVVYDGTIVPDGSGELDPRQIVRAIYSITPSPTAAAGQAVLTLIVDGTRIEFARFDLRASDRKFSPPQIGHSQIATLGDAVQFLGYDLPNSSGIPGGPLSVKLYWHATRPVKESYKVFVHLLDPNGILRAQQDSIPHSGTLPTDQWLAGEYVPDDYTLTVPRDVLPGEYRIEIGMYSPETGARAPVLNDSGARLPNDRILLDTPVLVAK